MKRPSRPDPGLAAFALAILALAGFGVASSAASPPAEQENPRVYCAHMSNDDTLRLPPPSLTPGIRRLLNMSAPDARGFFQDYWKKL